MGSNKQESARYRTLADRYGITESEARKIVCSFFGTIENLARGLPFDTPKKIYSKERFNGFVKVCHIPGIGRIGPVYSKYLKWRANMSEQLIMAPRSSYRRGMTQSELETIAESILSGSTPPQIGKRKNSELFNRVWLVGRYGKKSARQVIPKEEK